MSLEPFKHCRLEEQYEVGLASGRLNALLSSQALLITGWAIVHGSNCGTHTSAVLVPISCVALIICFFGLMAIGAALAMIRRLRGHGEKLISKDRAQSQPATLENYHLDRPAIDGLHRWGVEAFSLVVPFAFLGLWTILLRHSLP